MLCMVYDKKRFDWFGLLQIPDLLADGDIQADSESLALTSTI